MTPLALIGLAVARPFHPASVVRRHVVEIRDMSFVPAVLDVAAGDTVEWVNRDLVPHTATTRGKAAWDTGTLLQGQRGQVVVRERGEMPYDCRLHPVMRGMLRTR